MARAKNTDRAEARRRHRAAMAAADAAEASSEAEATAAGVSSAAVPRDARPSKAPASTAAQPRPGLIQAFRMAAAPAPVKEDIRSAPTVLRTTPALWLAPLAVLVGGIVLLVPSLRENNIGVLVAQLLVVPPPLIPSFLAGMLASRASWLFGLLTGLFAGLFFAIYVITAPASSSVPVGGDVQAQALLYAIVVSPLFGLATGAFAGFYRRFLRISQPERQQSRQAKSQKSTAKPSK